MTRRNNTLKHAIHVALGLMSLGLQGNALALGLGEIHTKSHLGEPLQAQIKVFGASEIKDAGCLKLGAGSSDAAGLPGGQLSLGAIKGDEATLTIRSSQAILDPILDITVIADCGSSVQRNYVLLLDPPTSAEKVDAGDENSANVAAAVTAESATVVAEPVKKAAKNSKTNVATQKHSGKKSAKRQQKQDANIVLSVNRDSNIASTNPHLSNSSQGNTAPSDKNKARTSSTNKLSISGGPVQTSDSAMQLAQLRMDKQLMTAPVEGAPIVADTTEDIADDAAALIHRIANLQKQIGVLEQENVALKRKQAAEVAESNTLSSKVSSAMPALGGILLLTSGVFGLGWWNRQRRKAAEVEEMPWLHADDENLQTVELAEDEHIFANLEPVLDHKESSIKAIDEHFEPTALMQDSIVLEEAESEEDAVLDHADVFLAHGRPALAIQLLQNHLIDNPKQSVSIWLLLLDLLAKEGLESEYEKTATECKLYFNIKVAEFSNIDMIGEQVSLEDYPRLMDGLADAWNTPAAFSYINDLIYNTRLEPRMGFDKRVLDELLVLRDIAQENFSSAEVIELDERKQALREQKGAHLATLKAEKLEQLREAMATEESKKAEQKAKEETFEFELVQWK